MAQSVLKRPFLGIPVWIWGVVIGGGLAVGWYLRQKEAKAAQGAIQVIQPQGAPPQASGDSSGQAIAELGEMFSQGITDLGTLLTGTVQSYAETSQAQFSALGEAIAANNQATLEAIQAIPQAIPQPPDISGILSEMMGLIGNIGSAAAPSAPVYAPPSYGAPPGMVPVMTLDQYSSQSSGGQVVISGPPGKKASQPVGQVSTSGQKVLYWAGQPFYNQSVFRSWINQHGSTIKQLRQNHPGAAAIYDSLPA